MRYSTLDRKSYRSFERSLANAQRLILRSRKSVGDNSSKDSKPDSSVITKLLADLNALCIDDVNLFSAIFIDLQPFVYQLMFYNKLTNNRTRGEDKYCKRLMVCKSRQIGFSTAVCIYALWCLVYNKFPSDILNNTKVGLFSRDDRAAKKLMRDIKNLIYRGDSAVSSITSGVIPNYFSRMVGKDNSRSSRSKLIDNMYELHFTNKCFIKNYPPTEAARGNTFDLSIVDEAAFFSDHILQEVIEPTVSTTDGQMILISTPNGCSGYFYELFDPSDTLEKHEYSRFWFWWKQAGNKKQLKIIEKKHETALATGNVKAFEQEYCAKFTSTASCFFDNKDIEKCIDDELILEYSDEKRVCSIGIDYGMNNSATCITVVADTDTGIRILYQYAEFNLDMNLLTDPLYEHSIYNLMKRYPNTKHIVVDDCPQGYMVNQYLESEGFPVTKFNFRSDQVAGERGRSYYLFRSRLHQNKIVYPEIKELIAELRAIVEIKQKVTTGVHAPEGMNDDRVDSLVMAAYPFMVEDGNFQSELVNYTEEIKKPVHLLTQRTDPEWDKIIESWSGTPV